MPVVMELVSHILRHVHRRIQSWVSKKLEFSNG